MSVLVDVAEAVKDELNDTEFAFEFDAELGTRAKQWKASELQQLRVDVVPIMDDLDLDDVGEAGHEITVDIFIRKKMAVVEQEQNTGEIEIEEFKALDDFSQSVIIHFMPEQHATNPRTGRLATYGDAAWRSGRRMSGFVDDKFAQTRVYMCQIRMVFVV